MIEQRLASSRALRHAATLAESVTDTAQLRESLGGLVYDEALDDTLQRVQSLQAELEEKETRAALLRRCLQSADRKKKDLARREMQRLGLTEHDLGAAWHHLPGERREFVQESLCHVSAVILTGGQECD